MPNPDPYKPHKDIWEPEPKPQGKTTPLPASSDKTFWGEDAQVEVVNVNNLQETPLSDHYLVWDGPYAKCVSCPFEHTIPLDYKKYELVDGKPVLKTRIIKK